jgi:hypothetical protein
LAARKLQIGADLPVAWRIQKSSDVEIKWIKPEDYTVESAIQ